MQRLRTPIDAIFGLSDTIALAARDAGRALRLVNQNTLIVCINGDPLALAAIAEDKLAATVETSAADLGHQAIELGRITARKTVIFPTSCLLVEIGGSLEIQRDIN